MVFNIDKFKNSQPLRMYLVKPDKTVVCELNGFNDESCSLKMVANGQFELSFEYYKYTNENKESNGYNYLGKGMYILVENVGMFKMKYPPFFYEDDGVEKKSVSANSIECELEERKLHNIKINTGEEDSLERLVTYESNETEKLLDASNCVYDYILFNDTRIKKLNELKKLYGNSLTNVVAKPAIDEVANLCKVMPRLVSKIWEENGETKVETYVKYNYNSNGELASIVLTNFNKRVNELISFYTKYHDQLDLMEILLKDTDWTVGEIDSDVQNLKLQFSIDAQNIYSILCQNMAQSTKCIFQFDLFKRKVNVVKVANYGKSTGISLSRNTLLNTLNVSCEENSIATRFEVSGANNLEIADVNFGSNKINDLSYYLHAQDVNGNKIYVSDEFANNYETYQNDLEKMRGKYLQYSKDLNQVTIDIDNEKYLLPNDFLSTDYSQFSQEELDNEILIYTKLRATLIELYRQEYGSNSPYFNADGSVNETTISSTKYGYDYRCYTYILGNLKDAIGGNYANKYKVAYSNLKSLGKEGNLFLLDDEFLKSLVNAKKTYGSNPIKYIKAKQGTSNDYEEVYAFYSILSYEDINVGHCDDLHDANFQKYFEYLHSISANNKSIIESDAISMYWDYEAPNALYINSIVITTKPVTNYFGDADASDYADKIFEYISDYVEYKNANVDAYKTDWDLYGTVELEAKISAYIEQIKSMIDDENSCLLCKNYDVETWSSFNVKVWSDLSKYEKSNFTRVTYINNYMECKEIYKTLKSAKSALSDRHTKITELENKKSDIQQKIKLIQKYSTLDGYDRNAMQINKLITVTGNYGFSSWNAEEIRLINLLYIDTEYSNENIGTTTLDDIVSKIDVEKELLEDAKEELSIMCQPQITFNANVENLFVLEEFLPIVDQFKIGNYVLGEYFDDYYVKLRITSITLNPLIPSDDITVTFSNYITSKSKVDDIASLLGNNYLSSAVSSVSSGGSGSGQTLGEINGVNTTISNTMLKQLLTTETFGTAVTNIVLDTMKLNSLTTKFAEVVGLKNGTTTIDGGCITTGKIQSISLSNNKKYYRTTLNLDDGTFAFGVNDNGVSGIEWSSLNGAYTLQVGYGLMRCDGTSIKLGVNGSSSLSEWTTSKFRIGNDGDDNYLKYENGILSVKGAIDISGNSSIAGFKITSNRLYNGTKLTDTTAYNNTSASGVILGNNGINICGGDASNTFYSYYDGSSVYFNIGDKIKYSNGSGSICGWEFGTDRLYNGSSIDDTILINNIVTEGVILQKNGINICGGNEINTFYSYYDSLGIHFNVGNKISYSNGNGSICGWEFGDGCLQSAKYGDASVASGIRLSPYDISMYGSHSSITLTPDIIEIYSDVFNDDNHTYGYTNRIFQGKAQYFINGKEATERYADISADGLYVAYINPSPDLLDDPRKRYLLEADTVSQEVSLCSRFLIANNTNKTIAIAYNDNPFILDYKIKISEKGCLLNIDNRDAYRVDNAAFQVKQEAWYCEGYDENNFAINGVHTLGTVSIFGEHSEDGLSGKGRVVLRCDAGNRFEEYKTGTGRCSIGTSKYQWWEGWFGTVYANGNSVTSDKKKKNHVSYLSPEMSLQFVNEMKPVEFTWKDNDVKHNYGQYAQDLYKLCKKYGLTNSGLYEALDNNTEISLTDDEIDARDDEDISWAIKYEQLNAFCISAIQCLTDKLTKLEDKIEKLEEN